MKIIEVSLLQTYYEWSVFANDVFKIIFEIISKLFVLNFFREVGQVRNHDQAK